MERVILRSAVGDDNFGKATVGGQAFFSGQPSPGEGFGTVRRLSLEKECEERSKKVPATATRLVKALPIRPVHHKWVAGS
jgi:hypothetical protein